MRLNKSVMNKMRTNAQTMMIAMVREECELKGIDIDKLNLSWEQIEELYKQLRPARLERIRKSCK